MLKVVLVFGTLLLGLGGVLVWILLFYDRPTVESVGTILMH